MAYTKGETWFWRLTGICVISICALNVMFLLRGPGKSVFTDRESQSPVTAANPRTKAVTTKEHTKLVTTIPKELTATQPKSDGLNLTPPKSAPGQHMNVPPYLKKPVWPVLTSLSQYFNPNDILLLGKRREKKSVLVIGIPTVKRSKAFYLLDTINGLMTGASPQERKEMVFVVFIADKDQEYRNLVTSKLKEKYPEDINAGVIQVIISHDKYYPQLHPLPPLYGDSFERVRWRAKQAMDYSFLYYYCSDLGNYYLQLEDDVLTEPGYYKKIRDFIASKASIQWSTLEFGSRGFIGMMYKGENLLSLARFSRFYFWTMPIDWIFRIYNDIFLYGNSRNHVRRPPLFKHIGTFSSLEGQIRKLEDISAIPNKEVIVHTLSGKNNPPASLETSIKEHVRPHEISEPYKTGFFWGKTVDIGSTITITFQTKCKLSRVVFNSGSPHFPSDSLQDSDVLVSTAPDCSRFELLKSFKNAADVDVKNIEFKEEVKCLRMKLTSVRLDDHGRKRWLIIREIGVWTK